MKRIVFFVRTIYREEPKAMEREGGRLKQDDAV